MDCITYIRSQKETVDVFVSAVDTLASTEKDDLTLEETLDIISRQIMKLTITHQEYLDACENALH